VVYYQVEHGVECLKSWFEWVTIQHKILGFGVFKLEKKKYQF
jgi:hypothetical protein